MSSYNRYGFQGESIEYFRDLLLSKTVVKQFPDLSGLERKYQSYLNTYFHACLLAVYLEKEGCSLKNWNLYCLIIVPMLKKHHIYATYLSKFTEGNILEYYILHIVNEKFRFENILALKANNDSDPSKFLDDYQNEVLPTHTTEKIFNKLQVTMKIRGEREKKVWGDNDIVIIAYPDDITKSEAICIISCKTSLRERVYQSIFWATHSRIEGVAKHTFATLDKGNNGDTEIGHRKTDNTTRKTRDVLESTMDRVYVFRSKDDVARSYVIKDFEYIFKDLERWRLDHFGL